MASARLLRATPTTQRLFGFTTTTTRHSLSIQNHTQKQTHRRALHKTATSQSPAQPSSGSSGPDALVYTDAKGRTGGGESLSSSSNAPPKPKISNLSVPGVDKANELTEEQKKEVDEHNADFDSKHDHSNTAPDDKVDQKFWNAGKSDKGKGKSKGKRPKKEE